MRLIDADALTKDLIEGLIPKQRKNGKIAQAMVANIIKQIIALQPTIDAVPVIRCKDCKHRQKDTIFKKLYCDGREVVADWYCGDAERRGDED